MSEDSRALLSWMRCGHPEDSQPPKNREDRDDSEDRDDWEDPEDSEDRDGWDDPEDHCLAACGIVEVLR